MVGFFAVPWHGMNGHHNVMDQSWTSHLAMYPWDHLGELNAGHQILKAGQENGLRWDASRGFFRTIGLIQVYPLLHHDFPPISMANFNEHSMVDGFALRFLKSAHSMESCYPSGPCKICCAFKKRTDANSTQCDPFSASYEKVLISVCVCIYYYIYTYIHIYIYIYIMLYSKQL